MRTVALDLGSRRVDFCEIGDGGVIKRTVVRGLGNLGELLGPGTVPARVAFEACREGWHVAEQLRKWGHEPVMVDTTRVKQLGIGHHGRKTDRIDAEILATALSAERIPQAHILSPGRQELRFQLATRRMLVESRAQYVTAIRGIARAHGEHIPPCATRDFVQQLAGAKLEEVSKQRTEVLRRSVAILTGQIAELDQQLETLCQGEPVIERLTTVPGVGLIVAAAFVSVIDEARRFGNAHQVESYLGLVPSEETTGGRRRLGAISKAGNSYVRALLVEAAWSVLRSKEDDPLRRWARQVVRRRSPRIGVVALARRLAGILWAIWRDGTVYDGQHAGEKSAEGISRHARQRQIHAQAMKVAAKKAVRRKGLIARARAQGKGVPAR